MLHAALANTSTALIPAPNLPLGIRAKIYDIDNCIAPESNSHIVMEWDVFFAARFNIPLEEASRLRAEYFLSDGCSARGLAKHFGEPPSFVEETYAGSAKQSAARFIRSHNPPTRHRLAELFGLVSTRGVTQMILTQGHPDHYDPILDHLGLGPHVPAHLRLDRLNTPLDKREPQVWTHVLALLQQHIPGLQPHEVMVYEDTPNNLEHAAALGMHTVLIGARDPGRFASSIHYRAPTVDEVLEAFILLP